MKQNKKAEYMRKWRKLHPENVEYQKNYYDKYSADENNRLVALQRAKEYYNKNKERILKDRTDKYIKYEYGITKEDFYEMLQRQGGVCAICDKPCITGKTLSIDHNHETGEIRGLLCRKCNAGIGMLGDSPILLKKALDYLLFYK